MEVLTPSDNLFCFSQIHTSELHREKVDNENTKSMSIYSRAIAGKIINVCFWPISYMCKMISGQEL